jgi:hypothetical protein
MKPSVATLLFLLLFIGIYAQKGENYIDRIRIGDAANINSALREEAKTISYNAELNLLSASFILDPNSYPEVEETGTIGFFYVTSDYYGSFVWEDPIILYDPAINNLKSDFPSAILFNPEGNLDPSQAFAVAQSPVFDEDGKAHKLFAVSRLDGQESNAHIIENTGASEDGYWNQFGLCQAGNEVKCLNVITEGSQNAWTALSLQPIRGVYNGAFEWDDSQEIAVDLYNFSQDNTVAWGGQLEGHDSGIEMAWSLDGEIGYMWVLGVENEFFTGYQPIIYNTNDGGENWSLIRLDFQHAEYQAIMQDHTLPSESGSIVPHVFESAGVVDREGHLQMIVAIVGTSSDISIYPDSVANHYDNPGDLYQLSAYSYGLCQFTWIDSLNSKNMSSSNYDLNYAESIGWQHRLTASRDEYENFICFTWTDSQIGDNLNDFPDIYSWIFCHAKPDFNLLTNHSQETLYEGLYFFTNACDQVQGYGYDSFYKLHVLQAATPIEFFFNSIDDPVTFNYISGLDFSYGEITYLQCNSQTSQCLLIGNDDSFAVSGFKMSQNTPNPFTGETLIRIESSEPLKGRLEIHNLLGKKILQKEIGPIYSFEDIIISSDQIKPGIYFYSFVTGDQKLSKKMIVQ